MPIRRKTPKGENFTPTPAPPMEYTETVYGPTYVKRQRSGKRKSRNKNAWGA